MSYFEMTKTVIKSLFTRPATLMYPAKPAKKTALTRGHVTIDPAKCIACKSCQRKCPTVAIVVDPKEKTWEINRLRCIVCNCCVETCPTKCLFMETQYPAPMTAKEGPYRVTVAGPKKKEPVADGAAKPAEKKE